MSKKAANQPPAERQSLFTGDPALNACVGDNGGPYGFDDYADGFFEGAKQIVSGIRQGVWLIDTLIYPAAFSYRHGIELYVKHLIKELATYNQSGVEYNKNHNLQKNWKLLVAQAKKAQQLTFITDDDLVTAGKIIDEFCKVDPTGQVFRYPEDIKGNQHLKDIAVINVEGLEKNMDELKAILENWRNRFYDKHGAGEMPEQKE
jgi:hypothetical protein